MRMTHRFMTLLLAVLMLLTLLPALAEDGEFFGSADEVFGSEPAATPAPTAEPTAEPTAAPTAEPAVEPTAAPVIEEARSTFTPGLARIGAGVRIYEVKGLWGAYVETASRGVLYACEMNDKETAVRVCLNDGKSLFEGWVRADDVTMLTAAQTADYDADERDEDSVRSYRGHQLAVIRTNSSEPTPAPEATATPEPVVDIFVPLPDFEDEDVGEPAEEPDPTAAPDAGDEANTDEEEVFSGSIAPDVTAAPVKTPKPDRVDTSDVDKFVQVRTMDAPSNVTASHNRLGLLTIRWTGTSTAEAYRVLYKKAWEEDYRVLAQVTGTSYSTDTLDPTVVYYFRVIAVELNNQGQVINQSPPSVAIPYIVLGDVKINDPRGKDPSTIRLTWNAVEGATHYDVMMSIHGANDWHIVRTNLVTDYCDIANISFDETYDFRLIPKRVMDSGLVLTGNSSRVTMVGSPMETPSFYDYTWTEEGLQLTWDAIPGASGYVIYRRPFSEPDVTKYTKLVVLDKPVTSYVDTNMEPGEVYYYFVYSFKLCQPEGWRCFSLKGNIGMGAWMQQPTGIKGTSTTSDGIHLTWDPLPGASHYDVFITSKSGTMPTGNGNGRVSSNEGYHSSAQVGKQYYYRVRGVRVFSNGDVSTGPWSEEYAFTLQEAAPTYRALIVGNTYPNESNYLVGCDNDAAGMATMLRQMTATPYQVTVNNNLTDSGMINAIRSTFASAGPNDVSLFYFSGHGANSPDTGFHGALVGVHHTYLSVARLRETLDTIPGRKIVIIDSCHSGKMIGKSTDNVDSSVLNAFNSVVVNEFAAAPALVRSEELTVVEPGVELFTSEPIRIARGDNDLATNGYYVITAAHSTEESVSTGYDEDRDGKVDRYFGLFTYALLHGNGYNLATQKNISALNADLDSNREITLYEAYVYAKTLAQRSNPNQTSQIYPTNSGFKVWAK